MCYPVCIMPYPVCNMCSPVCNMCYTLFLTCATLCLKVSTCPYIDGLNHGDVFTTSQNTILIFEISCLTIHKSGTQARGFTFSYFFLGILTILTIFNYQKFHISRHESNLTNFVLFNNYNIKKLIKRYNQKKTLSYRSFLFLANFDRKKLIIVYLRFLKVVKRFICSDFKNCIFSLANLFPFVYITYFAVKLPLERASLF